MKQIGMKWKKIKSEKLFINYTGSCIIALAENEEKKFYNSDFLECYLGYDVALELHFTNGILDEVINLGDAIIEFRALEETEEYKSENTQPFTRKSLRKEIAYKHLKYEYDYRNYKWGRSINWFAIINNFAFENASIYSNILNKTY